MSRVHRHRPALGALLLLLPLSLTACGGGSGGAVSQIAPGDREGAVVLKGTDLDGKAVDVADYRGQPVVISVWGSWCGPCNEEAPDVVAVAKQLQGTAQFLGVDVRDNGISQALAYQSGYGLTYPSIYSPDSAALLGFPGAISPDSVPAFAVLDSQGRVAATILGELPSELTLIQLVDQVATEDDPSQGASTGPADG